MKFPFDKCRDVCQRGDTLVDLASLAPSLCCDAECSGLSNLGAIRVVDQPLLLWRQ